jgi:GGDEF domain-containing protein
MWETHCCRISRFARPFEIEGHTIRAVARAGVARYPEDGENALELIENAEAALKSAKSAGERFLPYRLQMHRGQDNRRVPIAEPPVDVAGRYAQNRSVVYRRSP